VAYDTEETAVRSSPADLLVFDAWTPMSFKRQFGSRSATGAGAGFNPPPWVGEEHHRRLLAYAVLRAYQDNAAREFMLSSDRQDIDDRREYGEAALLVNTVLAALLGEDQAIIAEGADETGPSGEATAEAKAAQEFQEWLEQWAKDERLPLKVIEGERRAIGLGDAVYTLGWSPAKGRPRLRVWDPMFYFPVLDDGNEDEFPRKVHVAWEVPDPDLAPGKRKIRRITWELGAIAPANQPGLIAGLFRDPELFDGDVVAADGQIVRQYQWNDGPSPVTCYLTDATWVIDLGNKSVDDLREGSATYAEDEDGPINRRDLQIDFMPVVHVPNTVSIIEHFGRSVLSTVLQLLDDISNADTDLASASATTGHPVIALQGAQMQKDSLGRSTMTYRPGEVLESGDGKLDVLDTSRSLDALIKYLEFLLKRLSVNSRVAEALLGRVKASEVPSGVALALSFGPTEQLVKEMRLVRDEKYPLLLKFAHRLALAGGQEGAPAEWVHTSLVMGSFLPQDRTSAVDEVTKLLAAKAISRETAIIMLVEAGFPVKDAQAEVAAIESRDFEGAEALLAATGDKALVYEYLGKEQPEGLEPGPAELHPPQPPAGDPADPGSDASADDLRRGPDGQPVAR
jgi:hypothetical protein